MQNKNGLDLDTSDWDSTDPYTNDDCKNNGRFHSVEYVEQDCLIPECTDARMTECGADSPGERFVIQNGEAVLVACEPGSPIMSYKYLIELI